MEEDTPVPDPTADPSFFLPLGLGLLGDLPRLLLLADPFAATPAPTRSAFGQKEKKGVRRTLRGAALLCAHTLLRVGLARLIIWRAGPFVIPKAGFCCGCPRTSTGRAVETQAAGQVRRITVRSDLRREYCTCTIAHLKDGEED